METLVPHLVATLIYLSQIYSYYIRGDMPPLTIRYLTSKPVNKDVEPMLVYVGVEAVPTINQ